MLANFLITGLLFLARAAWMSLVFPSSRSYFLPSQLCRLPPVVFLVNLGIPEPGTLAASPGRRSLEATARHCACPARSHCACAACTWPVVWSECFSTGYSVEFHLQKFLPRNTSLVTSHRPWQVMFWFLEMPDLSLSCFKF